MADNEELLKILEEHGKTFLNSFRLPPPSSLPQKRPKESDSEEEEWCGIQMTSSEESESEAENDFEQSGDEFMADSSNVVVFSDPTSKMHHDPVSRAQMKAFMSSRINKLTSDSIKIAPIEEEQENEEEKTNTENDALLHRLVHTQLLSGSRNPDLNLTPAERKRALAGRILELAGTEKLGKGERSVVDAERRRAGKRVREGLASKQKERQKQQLEEAKNLGNYHPVLKKTFEASSKTKTSGRRSRGLGMGIGRFNAGILKLSKEDISKAESAHAGAADRGRGRGRQGRRRGPGRAW